MRQWLYDYVSTKVRARTADGYTHKIERHILPAPGSIPLKERVHPKIVSRAPRPCHCEHHAGHIQPGNPRTTGSGPSEVSSSTHRASRLAKC